MTITAQQADILALVRRKGLRLALRCRRRAELIAASSGRVLPILTPVRGGRE